MRQIIFGLLAVALIGGCAKTPETTVSTEAQKPAETQKTMTTAAWPTDVVIHKDKDGNVSCPVLSTKIDSPDKAVGFQDYKGVRYYFCCSGCPEQFKENPDKFAEKSDTPKKVSG